MREHSEKLERELSTSRSRMKKESKAMEAELDDKKLVIVRCQATIAEVQTQK